MNKKLLIIPFIVGVLIFQIVGAKINEYQQRINNMQGEIQRLNNDVDKHKKELSSKKNTDSADTLTMVATAYNAETEQCGNDNGITASGIKVRPYRTVAVDPNVIPLGSVLNIKSDHEYVNGIYIAEDTGNIKGNKIDVYMTNRDCAEEFGRRQVEVEILKYGWSG